MSTKENGLPTGYTMNQDYQGWWQWTAPNGVGGEHSEAHGAIQMARKHADAWDPLDPENPENYGFEAIMRHPDGEEYGCLVKGARSLVEAAESYSQEESAHNVRCVRIERWTRDRKEMPSHREYEIEMMLARFVVECESIDSDFTRLRSMAKIGKRLLDEKAR